MPLRDHFHPPVSDEHSWDALHAAWPTTIVMALKRTLPAGYVALPHVKVGGGPEIDVSSYEKMGSTDHAPGATGGEGGVATAVWAPPTPTLDVVTDLPDQDEYEVRVYDTRRGRRLVAAVELVSPANKDRPEHRREFIGKCAALLKEQVSVAIVDIVTDRHANLYAELLDLIGQPDPALGTDPPATYAAACRWTRLKRPGRLQAWTHPLSIGAPLPQLALWLTPILPIPLELEPTYEQACEIVSIP